MDGNSGLAMGPRCARTGPGHSQLKIAANASGTGLTVTSDFHRLPWDPGNRSETTDLVISYHGWEETAGTRLETLAEKNSDDAHPMTTSDERPLGSSYEL